MRAVAARCRLSTFAAAMVTAGGLAAAAAPAGAQTQIAPVAEGHVPIADSARLYYAIHGTGPDTVIVPGGFMLAPYLAPVAEHGFTMVFFDMRGRGRSDWIYDPKQLTFAAEIRDIEAVRGHLGIGRAALIGFSYLGLVTAIYAADNPTRVTRLVQMAPQSPDARTAARYSPPELKARSQDAATRLRRLRAAASDTADPAAECRRWYEAYNRVYVGDTAAAARVSTDFCAYENEAPARLFWRLEQMYKSMGDRWDLARKAAAIEAPTLVIQGDADLVVSPDGARRWAGLIPDARLMLLAGAGHLVHVERGDRVIPAIARFLGGSWPPEAMRTRSGRD